MQMMALPVFDPTDSPTGTWGGTMIGIPKACKNPDAAWKLIEKLYFSEEGLRKRREETSILPPVKSDWDDPSYHQPDPFFGGQKVNELYTQLAHRIPARYVTPATAMAHGNLNYVLNLAVKHLKLHGPDGLQERCQEWLNLAAADLQRRMDHWRFE